MPAITSLVASVFVDDVAEHVVREHYPAERPGTALPVGLAMREGRQDRSSDALGLPDRAAVRVRGGSGLHRILYRNSMAARA
jgi:hypothetical protein